VPDGQASVSGRTLRVSILALLKSVLDFNSGSNGSFNHSTDKRDPGLRLGWMKVPPGPTKKSSARAPPSQDSEHLFEPSKSG